MRVRFAPSPTGHLHVGNARTALFNWLMARGAGGTFILRIEDTDQVRSTSESERAILEDLRWLGLDWDEGPDVGGPYGPYRQSERLQVYRSCADELLSSRRAYYCFCSPQDLEAARQDALREGRAAGCPAKCWALEADESRRRVEAGENAVVRLRVPADREVAFEDLVRGPVIFHSEVIGDPVLMRSDGFPAYNFAVVIDDALMKITDVVRGEDHISNTPRQLLVYEALGFKPPRFAHLALVVGPDHAPLSKRHGATSVAEFRRKGYLPEALLNHLALIGWSPGGDEEILPARELARRFSIEAVGASAGVFDETKLAWMNRHYLRQAEPRRLAELSIPYFQRVGRVTELDDEGLGFLETLVRLAAGSVDRLEEVPERVRLVFDFDVSRAMASPEVAEILSEEGARDVVRKLARELSAAPRLDRERFREVAGRLRQQTGLKGSALFHPVRLALTGETSGPELDLLLPAIDRGAELRPEAGVKPILGCRERAASFAAAMDEGAGKA
ncbi:MAG: glutamate--tRNA ligase [Vicinamibacterales bacterium]